MTAYSYGQWNVPWV